MKLVKKILRLLPILFILSALIGVIFYNINLNQNNNALYYFELENGIWDNFIGSFEYIITAVPTPFNDIFTWFVSNISDSYFIYISFYILCYELFLSLMFLLFDFINMVFGWANKLIEKGAKSVE